MSEITFTENGEEYWFDSETGETNYKGESDALIQTISSIENTAVDVVGTEVESEPGLDGRERVYSPEKAEEMVKSIIEIESDLSLAKGPQVVDLEDESGYDEPLVLKGTFVKRVYVDNPDDVPNGVIFMQDNYGDYCYIDRSFFDAKSEIPDSAEHIGPNESVPEGYVEFTGPRGGTYGISPDDLADELGEDVSTDAIEEELADRIGSDEGESVDDSQVQSEAASDKIPEEDREVPDGVSGPIEEWDPDNVEEIVSPNMRFAEIGSEAHPLFYRRPEPDEIDEYVESVRDDTEWQEGMEAFNDGFVGGDNTKNEYTDEDGNWDEERLEKHDEWTDDLLNPNAEVPEDEQPTGMLVLGPPGAGKGYWQEQVEDGVYGDDFNGKEFTHVNSDETKEPIPEYEGSNASEVHDEASKMAKDDLANKSVNENHNVMLDKVATTPESTLMLMEKMQDAGYDLRASFVDVPDEKAAHNAVSRFYQEGRFTPFDYLLDGGPDGGSARDGSLNTFETVIEEMDIDEDKIGRFNNDVEWGDSPDAEQVGDELLKTFYEWLGFDVAKKYIEQVE